MCARPDMSNKTTCDNFYVTNASDALTCTDMSVYLTPARWKKYAALTVDPMFSGR